MKSRTRRAIAYIAGRIVSGLSETNIYDSSDSQYYSMDGSVQADNLSVYDYTEKCYISGSLPNLFHYGNEKALTLNMTGDKFTGYDYDESSSFSGSVSGNSISIYDGKTSPYFKYSF